MDIKVLEVLRGELPGPSPVVTVERQVLVYRPDDFKAEIQDDGIIIDDRLVATPSGEALFVLRIRSDARSEIVAAEQPAANGVTYRLVNSQGLITEKGDGTASLPLSTEYLHEPETPEGKVPEHVFAESVIDRTFDDVVDLARAASESTLHQETDTHGPVTLHEPVTHIVDLIRPGIDDVTVLPLPVLSGGQQQDMTRAIVLSEGLVVALIDTPLTEEPCVVPEAHSGTYVLFNSTVNPWSGTLLCLRNYEQVRCSETAGVWAVALEPGESAEVHISFRPVGSSGRADHIHIVPIAAPYSERIGRIGGVYAASAPDTFEESKPVIPGNQDIERVDCETAALDGSTLVVRLCDERDSLLRVLAFPDGTAMTIGSKRRPRRMLNNDDYTWPAAR